MSGCASVQLDMAALSGERAETAEEMQRRTERATLVAAAERLEAQPWGEAESADEGIVNLIFGGSPTSPRAVAEGYVVSLNDSDATVVVREDIEQSLAAAWEVAYRGREAMRGSQPIAEDLRTLENAIVEARQCRLVYAEAMSMVGEAEGTFERDEIRRTKQRFTQAILELGRTADVMTRQLEGAGDTASFADRSAAGI